jgi:hypothetical protein
MWFILESSFESFFVLLGGTLCLLVASFSFRRSSNERLMGLLITSSLLQERDVRTLKSVSVVGYMVEKSFQRVEIAGGILLAALLGYVIIDNFFLDLNFTFLGFLVLYAFVFAANQLVFQYRVSKGYYGTTASEAREIIQFIIDHSDDPDFPSGKKQIFPERDLEELKKTLPVAGGREV